MQLFRWCGYDSGQQVAQVASDILNSLGTKEREAGMAVAQIGASRKG